MHHSWEMEDKGLQNAGEQGKNAYNYGKSDQGIWKEYISAWITSFLGKTNTINERYSSQQEK